MARQPREPTAYIAIYPSKGTRDTRFLSVLQILVRGRASELNGRSRIKSWTRKASKPLTLVHTTYRSARIAFLRNGTAEFKRAWADADWAFVNPDEPDLLAVMEGPIERLELAVGMLARHGGDLGTGSVLILFPK
jgi:hypothetical protein